MKLNESARYYLITLPIAMLAWFVLSLINLEFVNIIFFTMAYIWHFSLLAPKVKTMAMKSKNRFSVLTMVFKFNYYLQSFIRYEKFKYTPSAVRAISPLLFTTFLLIVGGSGNLIFTLLGSLVFELLFLIVIRKSNVLIMQPEGQEIPPVIPSEENSHE